MLFSVNGRGVTGAADTGESSHNDASNCLAPGQDSESVSVVPEPSPQSA